MVSKVKTQEQFLQEVKEIHGDKYDYSKVEYINNHTKVRVICREHGEFFIKPTHFLEGQGCKECFKINQSLRHLLTQEQFIKKAKEIHGDKYDYSKVKYKNIRSKVCIVCSEHGEFQQTANDHLKGCGCYMCGKRKMLRLSTTEKFIEKAKKIHNNKYDYSKVEYKNAKTSVKIICNKHGVFEQTPSNHLLGCGCPHCSKSKMVIDLTSFLKKNLINVIHEKTFDWLKINNNLLRLDIFLPDYDVAIECQGIQHFKKIEYWGGESSFQKRIIYDKTKETLCKEHNINLIYYSNLNIDFPYKIVKNKEEILKIIRND